MKTSELTGALLDYWVAKAEGSDDATIEDWGSGVIWCISSHGAFERVPFQPSIKWAQGGPIIEREMITVTPQAYDVGPATCSGWVAVDVPYGIFEDDKGRRSANRFFSKSYLEAAMLCYVTRKFGGEVEDLP